MSGLALSPDGRRLIASVATLDPEGKRHVTSLWELDPEGLGQPRRLTRSRPGEANPTFLPDGSILFTSTRDDPESKPPEGQQDRPAALWLLPAAAGEAAVVAAPPGGIDAFAVARQAGTVVLAAEVFDGAATAEADAEREKARREAGVAALLLEGYPFRFWDRFLAPRMRHLQVLGPLSPAGSSSEPPRDLTPDPGRRLVEVGFDVTPDGSTVVTGWRGPGGRRWQADLVAIDVASGEQRLLAGADADHSAPACSPDGRMAVCSRDGWGTLESAPQTALWLVDLSSGEGRHLAADLDLWPHSPRWAPDSAAVFFVADEQGHAPVFRVDVDSGRVTRLTAAGAYSDLCPSPDGRHVYALRSSFGSPPEAVVLDAGAADQQPRELPTPGLPVELPGRVESVTALAPDGTPIQSWLVLPPEASRERPAPLVLWIHGGPMMSFSTWSWRWCPHMLAARGYAVLLPNPALSSGFGQDFVRRGWGRWGEATTVDVTAALDAALQRPDIDASRTAAMGGSFGGYMANWLAGHTDRFVAIVTHASVWALDQSHGTSDDTPWFEREFGVLPGDMSRYVANSPHLHAENIRTPMLVIHGERDYRVPIGEALRLYTTLQLQGVPSQFLYFPDENHWVLKPRNSRLWYETVLAFLDHHVLGREWTRPELL